MSESDLRYGFGRNWAAFVDKNLSDATVQASMDHLCRVLKRDRLDGMRILDIGCGSGIHSLAMKRLGAAEVVGFDYDPHSVATSQRVRDWSGIADGWSIAQGSVLDRAYMQALGSFDLVYSWGVLHHTGAMWDAVRHAAIPIREGGEFYIALYSSDTYVDPSPEEWIAIKKAYNFASPLKKKLMEADHLYRQVIVPELKAGRSALAAIRNYGSRGMNIWADIKDWLGGYPMEFAGLHETQDFVARQIGLPMVNVVNGEGCTEYVFADPAQNAHWRTCNAQRALQPLYGPFQSVGGYGFQAHLPAHAAVADDNGFNQRSRLMLFEDGVPLGLAHTIHELIRNRGAGRFSHWQDWLVFSARDNTDPNANGRSYSFCLDY